MSGDSGIRISLTGQDGAVWDLVSHSSPVALLGDAVAGLHIEEIKPQVLTSARVAGQRRTGKSVQPRSITMSVRVGDESPPIRTGQAWRDLDSKFWRSLGVGQPCTLTVNDRSIQVSLDASTAANSKDPALQGKGLYSVELTADAPYWLGDEADAWFDLSPTVGTNMFGGGSGTKGPPFYIGVPQVGNSAALANLGDVDAWPRWTLIGPGVFTVGVGTNLVTMPFALSKGQQVVIDTDPLKQTIVDVGTGASLWPSMGASPVRFASIPSGDSLPIVVSVTGAQSGTMVGAAITPQYSRAW